MFVEDLSKEQIDEFIRKHLMEDFHPEMPPNRHVEATKNRDEPAQSVHYCSKTFRGTVTLYLLDDRTEPLVSREIEEAWIRYLYSIFDEEYKYWYMSKQNNLFK